MKYIDEINSFHDWTITNSISSSARLLWYALMHYCNRTGWKREFNIPISALELDTGLSKDTIIRARNQLQQTGRIAFRSRKGNLSAIYQIIYFASDDKTQTATQCATQTATQCATQTATQCATQTATIPRLEETRLDKTDKKKGKEKAVQKSNTDKSHEKKVDLEGIIKEFSANDPELENILLEWYSYRKGKTFTEHALRLNLDKLYKLSNGFTPMMKDIAKETVMNGWKSFFPQKKTWQHSKQDAIDAVNELYDEMGEENGN